MTDPARVAGMVLAAGAGTRFGGGKVRASLDGRPLVAHVLDAARAAGIGRIALVLGRDAVDVLGAVREADGSALDGVLVALNAAPERGLATSLRLGMAAATAEPVPDAVVVLLGDQPMVRPGVIRALVDAAGTASPGTLAVVPAYADDATPNPVLLLPPAWPLAASARGDRGVGALLAACHERLVRVAVAGANPDVDTRADLAALAESLVPADDPASVRAVAAAAPAAATSAATASPAAAPTAATNAAAAAPAATAAAPAAEAWAARVRAHHDQTARLRETAEAGDFYAPVSRLFIADPRRTDDAVLDHLLTIARPGETWLDIGAGAGRYALPLALRVREVIALDPSPGMLAALREQGVEHGIANVRVIEGRWPPDPAFGPSPAADVALIANLGYDVEAIGAFLDAMEVAAARLCVAILADRQPSAPAHAFWPPVHGERRAELPALDAFQDLLRTRGRDPREIRVPRPVRGFPTREELARWLRSQLFVDEGSAKDAALERELGALMVTNPDGSFAVATSVPISTGIVTWEPR